MQLKFPKYLLQSRTQQIGIPQHLSLLNQQGPCNYFPNSLSQSRTPGIAQSLCGKTGPSVFCMHAADSCTEEMTVIVATTEIAGMTGIVATTAAVTTVVVEKAGEEIAGMTGAL